MKLSDQYVAEQHRALVYELMCRPLERLTKKELIILCRALADQADGYRRALQAQVDERNARLTPVPAGELQ